MNNILGCNGNALLTERNYASNQRQVNDARRNFKSIVPRQRPQLDNIPFKRQAFRDSTTPSQAIGGYQMLKAITPDIRAERILSDATILLAENRARFLEVLVELNKKTNSLTGKNHPLASVLGRRQGDPMMDVMMRNVREARKRDE